MSTRWFTLVADVSSGDPVAIEPLLRRLVGEAITGTQSGLRVSASASFLASD
jgi:hypothetical protein